MADETLNITVVEDNGATNKLVVAVNNLADASDRLADKTDASVASSQQANAARASEADAVTKATNAVKGYTDAQGNYIRLVGQNASATVPAVTAQNNLATALRTGTLEAGRAAAGYGPLNAAQASAGAGAASFQARIADLNTQLAGAGAAASTASSAAAAVGTAAQGAATATGAHTAAAGANAQAVTASAAANTRAGAAAEDHGNRVTGARSRYGAFNETILSTIRQLGLLSVAFASIGAAQAASEQIQAQNSLRSLGMTAEQTAAVMKGLGAVQSQLGISVNTLARAYSAGSAQFTAMRQGNELLIPLMSQIGNLARANGASFAQYSTAAQSLFASFRNGVTTQETLNAITAQGKGFTDALLQSYQQMRGVMGSNAAVTQSFVNSLANGNITIGAFAQLVNNATAALNAGAPAPVTLESAYRALTGSLNEYIGTSTQGQIITGALSAAMLTLSQYPGVLVAGFTALAAVIATIGFAAFITAITTLIPLLAAIGTGIAAVVTVGGLLSGWMVAAIAAVGGLVTWLYKNADAYNQVSDSMGIVSQANAALAQGIVAAVDYIGNLVTAAYNWITSFTLVKQAVDFVSGALGSAGSAISGFIDSVNQSATKAAQSFSSMKAGVQDLGVTMGTTGRSMASITQLTADGSRANTQFTATEKAAKSAADDLSSSLRGVGTSAQAMGSSVNSAGVYVSAAERAMEGYADSLKATTTQLGVFTQAEINANANTKFSQGQSYRSDTGDSGGGSFGITNNYGKGGFYDVSSMPGFATGGSFIVGGSGGTDTTPVSFMATPGERVTITTPEQQRAIDAGLSAGMSSSGVPTAGSGGGSGNIDTLNVGTLNVQNQGTSSTGGVTTSTSSASSSSAGTASNDNLPLTDFTRTTFTPPAPIPQAAGVGMGPDPYAGMGAAEIAAYQRTGGLQSLGFMGGSASGGGGMMSAGGGGGGSTTYDTAAAARDGVTINSAGVGYTAGNTGLTSWGHGISGLDTRGSLASQTGQGSATFLTAAQMQKYAVSGGGGSSAGTSAKATTPLNVASYGQYVADTSNNAYENSASKQARYDNYVKARTSENNYSNSAGAFTPDAYGTNKNTVTKDQIKSFFDANYGAAQDAEHTHAGTAGYADQQYAAAKAQFIKTYMPETVPHSSFHIGYATGGSFMVGGSGSTDSQLVQFMATPNERVTITTPSQELDGVGMGPKDISQYLRQQPQRVQPIVNVNVKADDYGQFKRSQRQIAQDVGDRVARAVAR